MFGFFTTKCPLNTWEKTWTETRMIWLAEQFGIERLRSVPVVLPSDEFFPDRYEPSYEGVQAILDRLCGYMSVPASSIELVITPGVWMPHAAGMYYPPQPGEKAVIRVSTDQLAAPEQLIATLAHELSHELLLGSGKLDQSAPDHEWITDLLPVFLGLGIFAANVTVHHGFFHEGNSSWWTIGKQGYLPSRILGYAMALFAHMRGDSRPVWKNELRLDALSALKQGLRFIDETGDCLFHRDTWTHSRPPSTESSITEHLENGSSTRRLATLWDIQKLGIRGPRYVAAIVALLQDRDGTVAGEAAHTLASFGGMAEEVGPALRKALRSRHPEVRAGAAHALGELRPDPQNSIQELCGLIGDSDRNSQYSALWAITQFSAPIDEMALRRLMYSLEIAIIECDVSLQTMMIHALLTVSDDPEKCVRNLMPRQDEEIQRTALAAIKDTRRNPIDRVSYAPVEPKTE